MSPPVVSVEHVSLAYPIYRRPVDALFEALGRAQRHDLFWALRDISFRVSEGDRLGIIGANGAGKSTLLKVIAGTLKPTEGRVTVNGSISSLLSMVPAWNPEDSGLENIRYNLALKGIAPSRVETLLEEIVDFTELGALLEQPVRTLSTGMGARVSFAVATAADPDILIIDEVLGTGDGYFAAKAAARMLSFCARGRALIFVSHSMQAVQQFCTTAAWLQDGELRLIGSVAEVAAAYENDFRRSEDETTRAGNRTQALRNRRRISRHRSLSADRVYFRIAAAENATVQKDHVIESIVVAPEGSAHLTIPVQASAAAVADGPRLERFATEWRRVERVAGRIGRKLQHTAGRDPGGEFSVRRADLGPTSKVKVSTQGFSLGSESLIIEVLDNVIGEWRALSDNVIAARERSAWEFSASGEVPSSGAQLSTIVDRTFVAATQDVEIIRVDVLVDGAASSFIRERNPFAIRVNVLFSQEVPCADVCLKITRADGVHAFWQSSGINGENLVSPQGIYEADFVFDPNLLGAGEYFINVHVTTGWDYPANWPYSAVLARALNATRFTVFPELPAVNFGLLNQRTATKIRRISESGGEESNSTAWRAMADE